MTKPTQPPRTSPFAEVPGVPTAKAAKAQMKSRKARQRAEGRAARHEVQTGRAEVARSRT